MKHPHLSRTTLSLGLLLIGAVGVQIYEHRQLSQLTSVVIGRSNNDHSDITLSRMVRAEERLDDADSKLLVSDKNLHATYLALSNRIDSVETSLTQTTGSVQELSKASLANEELLMLRTTVEALDIRLSGLQRTQNIPHKVSSPTGASTRPNAASHPKAAPPPFTAIAIESRGGQKFLSVAPIGSTQLHQINLIRLGDTVPGTSWVLRSLNAQAAQFEVAGVLRTIPLAS